MERIDDYDYGTSVGLEKEKGRDRGGKEMREILNKARGM